MPLRQLLHKTFIENPRHVIRRFTPAGKASSVTRYLDENPTQKSAAEMRFIGMGCAKRANDIYTGKSKSDPQNPADWFDKQARRSESAYQRLINLDEAEEAFRLKQNDNKPAIPYKPFYSLCRDFLNTKTIFKQINPEVFFQNGRMWLVRQSNITLKPRE